MPSEQHLLPEIHRALASPSLSSVTLRFVKTGIETTRPQRNGDAEAKAPERTHVRVVDGDPPMLRLEINLYSWERGDSEIEVVLPHGGELSDLLHWALPEQRLIICGNLRGRIQEELVDVFAILQQPLE